MIKSWFLQIVHSAEGEIKKCVFLVFAIIIVGLLSGCAMPSYLEYESPATPEELTISRLGVVYHDDITKLHSLVLDEPVFREIIFEDVIDINLANFLNDNIQIMMGGYEFIVRYHEWIKGYYLLSLENGVLSISDRNFPFL